MSDRGEDLDRLVGVGGAIEAGERPASTIGVRGSYGRSRRVSASLAQRLGSATRAEVWGEWFARLHGVREKRR